MKREGRYGSVAKSVYAADFNVFRFLKRSAIFWIESASQEIVKVEVG